MEMNEDEYDNIRSSKQPKLYDGVTQCQQKLIKQRNFFDESIQRPNFVQGQIAVARLAASNASSSVLVTKPVIFNLTIDCLDEIFDYLNLQDLSSFGQTCKSMQKVAGEYFKRNYFAYKDGFGHSKKEIGIYGNEICMVDKKDRKKVQVAVFSPYITQLCQLHTAIGGLVKLIVKNIDNFQSLNQISYCASHLNISKSYEYFKPLLSQLEIINMWRCVPFEGDIYDVFLRHCDNLKRFNVELCELVRTRNDGIHEYPWLTKKYPKLEHLKLIPRKWMEINELNGFFMLNPNVRSFSTSSQFLWINRKQLLNSMIKLDTLEIFMLNVYDAPLDEFGALATRMQAMCNLINTLYDQGFYKELKLHMHDDTQLTIDEVASLCGLDVLSICYFKKEFNQLPLTLVRELSIWNGVKNINLKDLAEMCVRLEHLYLEARTINDILPFIRYSPNLKKIKAEIKDCVSIDMLSLNRERKKLPEAQKLILFVPDDIFLATKWTTRYGDVNLSLVELRRADSYQFITN